MSRPVELPTDDKILPVDHEEVASLHDKSKIPSDGVPLVSQDKYLSLWQTIKTYPRASTLSALAAFGAVSDGYQYNLPGNIIALPGFVQAFGTQNDAGKWAIDPQHVSLWSAGYTICYIIVLFAGTWPADKFGRKPMILSIQVFMAIACLLEMFATHWTHWFAAKMMNGLSVGINQSMLMTYISEIAPTQGRGALLANYTIWWGIGGFCAQITLKILNGLPVSHWKNGIYSEWVFTGLAVIIWFFLPESPRWYAERGNLDKAKQSLLRINGKVTSYDVEHELAVIIQEIEEGRRLSDNTKNVNILSVLRGTNLLYISSKGNMLTVQRRTYISFFPFAWQQWGGTAVINGYTAYYFSLAGLADPFTGSLIISIIKIVATLIAPVLIEMQGRRRLLMGGGIIMVLALYAVGGMLRAPSLVGSSAFGAALISVCCIWQMGYSSTLAVLGYVYLGETSTVLLRAKTTGVAAGSTGFLNLIVGYCSPLMLTSPNFGVSSTTFFYASTCLFCLVVSYFTIPETKGRTFGELDELFARRISSRKFAETKTEVDLLRERERALQV